MLPLTPATDKNATFPMTGTTTKLSKRFSRSLRLHSRVVPSHNWHIVPAAKLVDCPGLEPGTCSLRGRNVAANTCGPLKNYPCAPEPSPPKPKSFSKLTV